MIPKCIESWIKAMTSRSLISGAGSSRERPRPSYAGPRYGSLKSLEWTPGVKIEAARDYIAGLLWKYLWACRTGPMRTWSGNGETQLSGDVDSSARLITTPGFTSPAGSRSDESWGSV